MSLSEIKQANKRHRREQKRKKAHAKFVKQARITKIQNKKIRKMMVEGRKEDAKKRADANNYVDQLTQELGSS